MYYMAQVIQRRLNGSVDFYNDYSMYEAGFGSASDEYWFGVYAKGCHPRTIGQLIPIRQSGRVAERCSALD